MVEERRIRLWQDKVETQIDMNGDGPPLVFLHGPWGLRSDRDFLDRLAATHRIYAPRHPGRQGSAVRTAHLVGGTDSRRVCGSLLTRRWREMDSNL